MFSNFSTYFIDAFSDTKKSIFNKDNTSITDFHNSNLFWKEIFNYSLFLLPIGLVFGEVPTSVSEIIVFICWLLTGEWDKKIKLLKHNSYFWLTSSLYLISIFGLIYTKDFQYAFNDLRIKLPLLLFPIILFSVDFTKYKHFVLFLKWTSIVTFINLFYLWLNFKLRSYAYADARETSIFISHIRLGLIAAFSIISAVYLVINEIISLKEKLFFLIISGISFSIMISLGLMTGIMTLLITSLFALIYMIIKSPDKLYFRIITLVTICTFGLLSFYVYKIHKRFFSTIRSNELLSHSKNGCKYWHNINDSYAENGYLVNINICDDELKKIWTKRSALAFEGKDKKGNDLKYTIYRYLTSKGLTKDSLGLSQLSDKDIRNIECGIPNHLLADANFFEKRIYELFQEYHYFKVNKNPQGKTIAMRMLYWKIGFQIWQEHWFLGVGTGDIKDAFNKVYQEKYTHIPKNEQLRTHNQILTYAISFGIIGFVLILLNVVYPLVNLRTSQNFMIYYLFSIITVISFLIDDTLETQPGVTFYALFNTLLIRWLKEK